MWNLIGNFVSSPGYLTALIFVSWWYGYHCFEIHPGTRKPEEYRREGKITKENMWIFKINEHWTNALGAVVGLFALYLLSHLNWTFSDLSWPHLVLLFIAFNGLTGQLPFVAKFSKN